MAGYSAKMTLRAFTLLFSLVLAPAGALAIQPPPMPGQPPGQPGQPMPGQPTPMQPIPPTPTTAPSSTMAPSASPTPSAPPRSGQSVLPLAKQWVHRVQTGQINRSQLEATTSSQLTPSLVTRMKNTYGRLGTPLSVTFVNEQSLGAGNTAYSYRVRFRRVTVMERLVLDSAGKISGLSFAPAS
jgi:hypothetical protein